MRSCKHILETERLQVPQHLWLFAKDYAKDFFGVCQRKAIAHLCLKEKLFAMLRSVQKGHEGTTSKEWQNYHVDKATEDVCARSHNSWGWICRRWYNLWSPRSYLALNTGRLQAQVIQYFLFVVYFSVKRGRFSAKFCMRKFLSWIEKSYFWTFAWLLKIPDEINRTAWWLVDGSKWSG